MMVGGGELVISVGCRALSAHRHCVLHERFERLLSQQLLPAAL